MLKPKYGEGILSCEDVLRYIIFPKSQLKNNDLVFFLPFLVALGGDRPYFRFAIPV
jgi:hypothetical protein